MKRPVALAKYWPLEPEADQQAAAIPSLFSAKEIQDACGQDLARTVGFLAGLIRSCRARIRRSG